MVELSETVLGIFPDLTVGSTEKRKDAHRRAETWVSEPNNIADLLSRLVSPEPSRPFPTRNDSPEKWAFVALLQTRLLFVTDL